MLIEEEGILESLRQIIAGFRKDPILQADMMQECLFHLWIVERAKPDRTRSWYLQSCRFHLQHWLAAGRSLDSPKRANGDNQVAIDGNDEHPALSDYHTNGEIFDTICFKDVVATLAGHLNPRERSVLGGLAAGLTLSEIVSRVRLSYPTALKYRREIASLTAKLGISAGTHAPKTAGWASRAKRLGKSEKVVGIKRAGRKRSYQVP